MNELEAIFLSLDKFKIYNVDQERKEVQKGAFYGYVLQMWKS